MAEAINQGDELRKTIAACLDLDKPKSFFLYAGAGSGKTKAVVEAMEIFRDRYGDKFQQSGQKVAIITYTNAACNEIRRRIDFDPIFAVSTIHSFAWEQIRTFHQNISAWLRSHVLQEIEDLREKQASGRPGSKATAERNVQIETKRKRLQHLDDIKHFTYNPNGENIGKNSLNHSEVIGILAAFLANKPMMHNLLILKFPVMLIDESQDTQKDLIDAFITLQTLYSNKFILCLFGDTMQRIYSDGKVGLEKAIPDTWEKPAIIINHRCPKRIVRLLNRIREEVDGAKQEPRKDAQEGVARLVLVNDIDYIDKVMVEAEVTKRMAMISGDDMWMDQRAVKVLTLEHLMAARRGGFASFFKPLYGISNFKTGLLDGTLSGVAFFTNQVLPLVQALQSKNKFAVAQVIKNYSPIISPDKLCASKSSLIDIRTAKNCVESMFSMWNNDADPTLMDILKVIAGNQLLAIPDVFAPILYQDNSPIIRDEPDTVIEKDDRNPEVDAWRGALSAPFSQLVSFVDYISDRTPYGTHQGIKGLQFPRVMVILDDNEAQGFMFSYDKLLGAKPTTETDERNKLEGKDTSIDRTRRLFYVTCSRTQDSLVVVVYTKEADKIATYLSGIGWFEDNEFIRI